MTRYWIVFSTLLITACSGADSTTPSTPSASSNVNAQAPMPYAGPGESLLQLAWQPNNDGVAVGYRVYYGPTGDAATTQASDIALTAEGFNALAPSVVYNAQRDLGLTTGQDVCFRLRAYNSQGTLSGWSAPVCASI